MDLDSFLLTFIGGPRLQYNYRFKHTALSYSETLLQLIRISLGSAEFSPLPENPDWDAVLSTAMSNGLDAISFDGLQAYYNHLSKEEVAKLDASLGEKRYDWLGLTLQAEQNYEFYFEKLRSLVAFFRDEGIKVLVLKGYGLSLDYPIPAHRPTGDIDLYLYGRGKEADELVKTKLKIPVKQNEDKHSTFKYLGLSVENHARFLNDVEHSSLRGIESFLEYEARRAPTISFDGVEISVPSPIMNAIFLPCHMASHFVFGGMQLKQLTDWAIFTKKYSGAVDWEIVRQLADEAGCFDFLRALNGIVIAHFGVPIDCLPDWGRNIVLEKRIWQDTLLPRKILAKRGTWERIHDYFAASWKYHLIYRESILVNFFKHSWASIRVKYLPKSRSVWDD